MENFNSTQAFTCREGRKEENCVLPREVMAHFCSLKLSHPPTCWYTCLHTCTPICMHQHLHTHVHMPAHLHAHTHARTPISLGAFKHPFPWRMQKGFWRRFEILFESFWSKDFKNDFKSSSNLRAKKEKILNPFQNHLLEGIQEGFQILFKIFSASFEEKDSEMHPVWSDWMRENPMSLNTLSSLICHILPACLRP